MTPPTIRAARWAVALALPVTLSQAACPLFAGYRHCDEVPAARLAAAPEWLADTGLFADGKAEAPGPGVVPYRPRFQLWSDGAEKRRWIFLPPGTRVDTRDMDAWQFPAGTKLWKEFSRGGVPVETRLLYKTGPAPDDWVAVAYVWSADGTRARATPAGAENARGTPHDVPAARHCMACHGGVPGRVLGFSAVQLAHDAPPGEATLARLAAAGRLSDPPAREPRVPGDPTVQEALGYLHANCAHCHNQRRPAHNGARCFDPRKALDFALRVGDLDAPERTAAYRTAVGAVIFPGAAAAASPLVERVEGGSLFRPRMPPLATEVVDPRAGPLMRAWIARIVPPQAAP
jgi:hypothetical protein